MNIMELITALKDTKPDEDVYIGSKSAFFFIGKPKDFNNALIEKLDINWHKLFSSRLLGAVTKYENCLNQEPKPEPDKQYFHKVWEGGKCVTREIAFEEFHKDWENKLSNCEKQLNSTDRCFNEFKSFKDREVKEAYRNIDRNATIIIVEGCESSRFWFKYEYEQYRDFGTFCYADDDEESDDNE